jgi:nitrate/nitrite-specific signal transduction histidine kinase
VTRWLALWSTVSIRRRILISMLAVSVIPLGLFSLAGLTALSGLNSGSLATANNELVANQSTHLEDLVNSRAAIVNDDLASIESQVALLGRAASNILSEPAPQAGAPAAGTNATILGSGATAADPGAQVVQLRSLEAEMTLVSQLHPEVAEVWLQLPGFGLLEVSPSTAVTRADSSRFEQLLPSQAEYELGVAEEQDADQLQSAQWRELVARSPQTAVWTPVYSNSMTGGQTVTVATEGVTAGGLDYRVGANITVHQLVSSLLSGPPGSANGSYAFIVSGDGAVISVGRGGTAALGLRSKAGQPEGVSLTSTHNPWFKVANQMRLGVQGYGQISLDGSPVDVFYSPLPASRWSLGVAIPVSGLDSSVVGFAQQISHGLTGVTALLLPVLLLLALLVITFTNILSRRLLGPLSRLTSASARIASGDLDTAVAISPGPTDEIGILEHTLERMRARLKEQHHELEGAHQQLEHKVDERTAELTQRNQELAALNSLTAEMSRSLVVSDVASTAAEQLRVVWGLPGVAIYLVDGLEPTGMRLVGRSDAVPASADEDSERSVLLAEMAATGSYRPQVRSGQLLVPLTTAGDRVGYLALSSSQTFAARQLELLEVVGGQLALALRNAQLFADTQELATINERNRIAREIHDTLAQGLAGIIVQLQAADAWLGPEPPQARTALTRATELARSSLQEARRSVWDLRPEGLQRAGLAGAVRDELAKVREDTGTKTSLRLKGMRSLVLPAEVEVAVFRIIQEALANALRHARPTAVTVEIARCGQQLRVTVGDNGLGFAPSGHRRMGSFGITSMRERAGACGGSLKLVSTPGSGTQVILEVPYEEPSRGKLAAR